MDTGTLLSTLFDCDASMTSGSSIEGRMHYRNSIDTELAVINAFLHDYSPVETLSGLDDMSGPLTAKDECFMNPLSMVNCRVQDTLARPKLQVCGLKRRACKRVCCPSSISRQEQDRRSQCHHKHSMYGGVLHSPNSTGVEELKVKTPPSGKWQQFKYSRQGTCGVF